MSEYIVKRLFELQDKEYKEFHSKLMPTVDPENIIGVRTPALRKLAAELWKEGAANDFMAQLPHHYYEENNLHGFFIEKIKDYNEAVAELDKFLSYVDNWATCDLISPKVFKKHPEELFMKIKEWIKSDDTYTVRFGLGMLMSHFLDEHFTPEVLDLAASVRSEEYYINMMIAWFFATALTKQYDSAVRYIEEKKLDVWTHNKAIQKAVESYRVPADTKAYLKTLKIK